MRTFYTGSICSIGLFVVAIVAGVTGMSMESLVEILVGLILFFLVVGGLQVVKEWNRRPVLRFGKYVKEIGPGICWINPLCENTQGDWNVYDKVYSVAIEAVQTKDNIPLAFQIVLTTQITRLKDAVVKITHLYDSIKERATAASNATIRAHNLEEILGEGLGFSDQILRALKDKVTDWGVEVKAVEIKDFKIIDNEIQQAIAMKARAQKEAEAELKRAEMQKQITERLNEAADVLDDEGWRLKSLEVLVELCRSANNNTILIPTDMQSLAKTLMPAK